jgi:hypothetical protein
LNVFKKGKLPILLFNILSYTTFTFLPEASNSNSSGDFRFRVIRGGGVNIQGGSKGCPSHELVALVVDSEGEFELDVLLS